MNPPPPINIFFQLTHSHREGQLVTSDHQKLIRETSPIYIYHHLQCDRRLLAQDEAPEMLFGLNRIPMKSE
jgi:hypothetical protein